MSAVEPLAGPTGRTAAGRSPSRHLRPVRSRSVPTRNRKGAATQAAKQEAPSLPPQPPAPDIVGLSAQLRNLEQELRHTWTQMLELDAAAAGRVGHARRLVHQAGIVLGDYSAIY
jgi:hypothetical protein